MTVTSAGNNKHSQLNLIDFSNCKSYSIYQNHAVAILNDGTPMAIGDNNKWPIYKTLPRYVNKWTRFFLQDSMRNTYFIESAVCGTDYTLYLLDQSTNENACPLAYVKRGINRGSPSFISTNGIRIYAIYGGSHISAAIDIEGIIHIIDDSIYSNNFCTKTAYLPWANMPILLAFQDDYVIALSSYGNVYELDPDDEEFEFIDIPDCSFISGTANHCIAVTTEGEVYVRGSNEYEQLGLGQRTSDCDEFILIAGLRSQNIKEAYAGEYHSLFVNQNGKILACGSNQFGELFKRPSGNIIQASGTSIDSDALFCIAGSEISVAFINCNPPPNSPNQILRPFNDVPFLSMFENNDALKKENDDLKATNQKLMNVKSQFEKEKNDALLAMNQKLAFVRFQFEKEKIDALKIFKNQNENLKKENLKQKQIVMIQKAEIESLKKENVELKKLKQSNDKQQETINSQNEEIERLKMQIEELKKHSSSQNTDYNNNNDDKDYDSNAVNEDDDDDDEYDDNSEEFFKNNKDI